MPTVGAMNASVSVHAGSSVSGYLSYGDTDGSPITITAGAPSHGTVSLVTGTYHYTPTGTYVGSDSFTFTATAASGGSATATVSVAVTNTAPGVTNGSVTTHAGTAVTGSLGGGDPDGDPLTTTVGTPSHGTVTANGSAFTYTPAKGYVGADSFSFTMTDPFGASATGTETVTMTNTAPGATGQNVSTLMETPYTDTIQAGDPDGDPLTMTASTPANGTVTVNGLSYTYTPNAGYSGADSFTCTVSDGNGGTAPAIVNVNVQKGTIDFNGPPTAPAKNTIQGNGTYANAPPGAKYSVSYTVIATGQTVELSNLVCGQKNGTFTYNSNSVPSGSVKITLTLTDNGQVVSTKTSDVINVP